MPAGRPRKIKSPEEMDRLVDEYVAERFATEKPVTLTGMILHMGLACRDSLDEYGRRDEFSYSVKRAKSIIEDQYEQNLHAGNSTGSIFALKNFGWKDKTETELSGPDGGAIKTDNKFIVEIVSADK